MNLHKGNYRNPKILRAAIDVPMCFGCGTYNHGNVVAAHADWQEYGKGKSLKAHDWAIAYLCNESCHHWLHSSGPTKAEKKEFWNRAHIRSMEWMFNNGIVR